MVDAVQRAAVLAPPRRVDRHHAVVRALLCHDDTVRPAERVKQARLKARAPRVVHDVGVVDHLRVELLHCVRAQGCERRAIALVRDLERVHHPNELREALTPNDIVDNVVCKGRAAVWCRDGGERGNLEPVRVDHGDEVAAVEAALAR